MIRPAGESPAVLLLAFGRRPGVFVFRRICLVGRSVFLVDGFIRILFAAMQAFLALGLFLPLLLELSSPFLYLVVLSSQT